MKSPFVQTEHSSIKQPTIVDVIGEEGSSASSSPWWKKALIGVAAATALSAASIGGYMGGVFYERSQRPPMVYETQKETIRELESRVSELLAAPDVERVIDLQSRNDELWADNVSLVKMNRELLDQQGILLKGKYREVRIAPAHFDSLDTKIGEYVLEINKEDQQARIWKRTDYVLVAEAPCSTGLVPGDKEREGDMRTATGPFSIVSVQNSSDWVFEGRTGEYGPYFFRMSFGNWDKRGNYYPDQRGSLGVHSTSHNDDLGSPASHGCTRVYEGALVDWFKKGLIGVGMKGYVIPEKDASENLSSLSD